MKPAGNDIVDLNAPHAKEKSRHARYVDRILTDEEKYALVESDCPDDMLWMFWTAKETALKVVRKIDGTVHAIPGKYRCRLGRTEGWVSGVVHTPVKDVRVAIRHGENYLHCIGTLSPHHPERELVYGVHQLYTSEDATYDCSSDEASEYVRTMVKNRVTGYLSGDDGEVMITSHTSKEWRGFPEVMVNGRRVAVDLSLSHDGRYVAYAFYPGK